MLYNPAGRHMIRSARFTCRSRIDRPRRTGLQRKGIERQAGLLKHVGEPLPTKLMLSNDKTGDRLASSSFLVWMRLPRYNIQPGQLFIPVTDA